MLYSQCSQRATGRMVQTTNNPSQLNNNIPGIEPFHRGELRQQLVHYVDPLWLVNRLWMAQVQVRDVGTL